MSNTTNQNQLKKKLEVRAQGILLRGLRKLEAQAQVILLRGLRKLEAQAQVILLRGLRKLEAQAQVILLRGLRKPEAYISNTVAGAQKAGGAGSLKMLVMKKIQQLLMRVL
jgi:hypothetical protein